MVTALFEVFCCRLIVRKKRKQRSTLKQAIALVHIGGKKPTPHIQERNITQIADHYGIAVVRIIEADNLPAALDQWQAGVPNLIVHETSRWFRPGDDFKAIIQLLNEAGVKAVYFAGGFFDLSQPQGLLMFIRVCRLRNHRVEQSPESHKTNIAGAPKTD